jgi:hypothetical protein
MHVLLVEDDVDLGRALLQGLKSEGITCEWVRLVAAAPSRIGLSRLYSLYQQSKRAEWCDRHQFVSHVTRYHQR